MASHLTTLLLQRITGRALLFAILVMGAIFFSHPALAATNVDAADFYAWNTTTGWIDHYSTNTVVVTTSKIEGYASSTTGEVSFDCATTSGGNICATSTYAVANDGVGNLSGYAWNDSIGWISFYCGDPGVCASSNYQVTIDGSRYFNGYAWNDIAGWISYNCANDSSCGTSDYKVRSAWAFSPVIGELISSTFDTQIAGGAAMNSILWRGTQPSNTLVRFQIASSNCSNGATNDPTCSTGTWSYIGTDGTVSTYYNPGASDTPVEINRSHHNNKRYFRYKAYLQSDDAQTVAPTVTDIIINWSP